jgi:transketolase N-terminal domain/subunit
VATVGPEVEAATRQLRLSQSWAATIRRLVLDESRRANVGHIGSSLCVADILAVLYGAVLRAAHPSDPDRDRFVMSKGHAALGCTRRYTYAVGWLVTTWRRTARMAPCSASTRIEHWRS